MGTPVLNRIKDPKLEKTIPAGTGRLQLRSWTSGRHRPTRDDRCSAYIRLTHGRDECRTD